MILAPLFSGDDDTRAMNMQHDCYGLALGVVIEECNRLIRFARIGMDDQNHVAWGNFTRCDHRTLQASHDILAAVWRFQTYRTQGALPLAGVDPWTVPDRAAWLAWLRAEVSNWTDAPELVRAVQVILANQNTDPGYQAEEYLEQGLFRRFREIPWNSPRALS